MPVYRIEVTNRETAHAAAGAADLAAALREAGLSQVQEVRGSRLFLLEGGLSRAQAASAAEALLSDPVTEDPALVAEGESIPDPGPGWLGCEVHLRPGVMDPVALSTLGELRAAGFDVDAVRTAARYAIRGDVSMDALLRAAGRVLANDCIEALIPNAAPVAAGPRPPAMPFELRHVAIRELDDAALERLSRTSHLFMTLDELRCVRDHFRALEREPTDLELETIAQTWSEHCVHKTLRSAFIYRGQHLPRSSAAKSLPPACGDEVRHYDNLLRDTIAKATEELMAAGRGPQCLSVFKDNAGVIVFDDDYGVAFKVETHNHPSAIEPYGGAATGVGGVIRDVIGCGLGARPIANTDVFCVGPIDWPDDRLPKGVLHPRRVLRGIVQGVADYGNRMGIPTVNGALYFDPRYLGNPLVYCGCAGLIPRHLVEKQAQPGDHVVVVGGRTGRDGIHGATFSSAELTDTHADEFSHAVQIGNPITEKRFLDALLQARDAAGGCLYNAITDCGAGGLSSAVGEMGENVGATVDLERVPLKYAGLRYDEIWISEAQERMVVAVPPKNLDRFMSLMAAEEVEATVLGTFGQTAPAGPEAGQPQLLLRYDGVEVGALDMRFLHRGWPRTERMAKWKPVREPWDRPVRERTRDRTHHQVMDQLLDELRRMNVASREWIIRKYDHEVQGGSVIKPLVGPGRGPADAAVLRPRLDSERGIALGCGLTPRLSDLDPYWMAAAAIDEAVRNVVCVGGDPRQSAILDNFCWGRSDDERQLGALVRACQACYDVAMAYGTPFISGKDSLNNEFALDAGDVEPLLQTLRERAARPGPDAEYLRRVLPELEQRITTTRRLGILPTLLISALSIVADVRRCITPDLKQPGDRVYLVGGLPITGFDLQAAAKIHTAVADVIQAGRVRACHDLSDAGWLVSLAEMAFTGRRGVAIEAVDATLAEQFARCCAGYVLACDPSESPRIEALRDHDIACVPLGTVRDDDQFAVGEATVAVDALRAAWAGEPATGRE